MTDICWVTSARTFCQVVSVFSCMKYLPILCSFRDIVLTDHCYLSLCRSTNAPCWSAWVKRPQTAFSTMVLSIEHVLLRGQCVLLSSATPLWQNTFYEVHVKPKHEFLTWSLQQYCYTWVYVHILECLYLPIDSGQFGVYSQVRGTWIRVKSILF